MREFLVMPCRTHAPEDKDFAVCCAVPCDARGVTIIARPAGRPGEAAAKFSAKYGQSVGVVMFDDVFVPHDRIFLAGETEEGGYLTTSYATHHRHSCIGARAGFGDLLIGAGALMIEANGLDFPRLALHYKGIGAPRYQNLLPSGRFQITGGIHLNKVRTLLHER